VVEKRGQIAEIGHEDPDRSVVEQDGHDFIFSAGTALASGLNPAPSH